LVAFGILAAVAFPWPLEYYWRKFGTDVCPAGPKRQTTIRDRVFVLGSDHQIQTDGLAKLQRQLNEESREQERLEKGRREWYVAFIKPFTMVKFEVKLICSEYRVRIGEVDNTLTTLLELWEAQERFFMPTKRRQRSAEPASRWQNTGI
jgi:hypothetical protein